GGTQQGQSLRQGGLSGRGDLQRPPSAEPNIGGLAHHRERTAVQGRTEEQKPAADRNTPGSPCRDHPCFFGHYHQTESGEEGGEKSNIGKQRTPQANEL